MRLGFGALTALVALSCKFDSAYRDLPDATVVPCVEGTIECRGTQLTQCVSSQRVTLDDCGAKTKVCAPGLLKCTTCLPGVASCSGFDVVSCGADGETLTKTQTCDAEKAQACRNGGCHDLCQDALVEHSNVGCEYWAVDLDNAVTSQGNAAAQQYAVVVSNNGA